MTIETGITLIDILLGAIFFLIIALIVGLSLEFYYSLRRLILGAAESFRREKK